MSDTSEGGNHRIAKRLDRTPVGNIGDLRDAGPHHAAYFFHFCRRRPVGTTRAPCSASPIAMALPNPDVAPITTATRSDKSKRLRI